MKNQRIKEAAARAGLKQYEIAALLGIPAPQLSVRMRTEMPDDEQSKIIALIEAERVRRAKAVLAEQG